METGVNADSETAEQCTTNIAGAMKRCGDAECGYSVEIGDAPPIGISFKFPLDRRGRIAIPEENVITDVLRTELKSILQLRNGTHGTMTFEFEVGNRGTFRFTREEQHAGSLLVIRQDGVVQDVVTANRRLCIEECPRAINELFKIALTIRSKRKR